MVQSTFPTKTSWSSSSLSLYFELRSCHVGANRLQCPHLCKSKSILIQLYRPFMRSCSLTFLKKTTSRRLLAVKNHDVIKYLFKILSIQYTYRLGVGVWKWDGSNACLPFRLTLDYHGGITTVVA